MDKKGKPYYLGHRERLRERFRKTGAEGFSDYELLELLLTFSILRKDTKPVAKQLIENFSSLSSVFDTSLKKLENVPGVGSTSAILIKLAKEIFDTYLAERMKQKDLLSSPQAAVNFARVKLAGLSHESFMVIYLNVKNEITDYEIIHEGTIDKALIYPRRIVESALAHHASGVLLVHNHPSGHPDPSDDDIKITRTIAQAIETMDIKVIDHIIVGKGGYCSFVEKNLI